MRLKCPERNGHLRVSSLLGKLDVWVNGVDVLQ